MSRSTPLTGLGGRIGPDAWLLLLRNGIREDHDADRTLLRQGDPGMHVLALGNGLVKVSRLEPDGTDLLLAARGPGEVLGEISALDHRPRSARVVTLRPSTTYRLSTPVFRRFVHDQGLYGDLVAHVLGRLREGEDIRAELAALPLPQRLARTVIRLANTFGAVRPEGTVIDLGMSQHELARAVGATRSPVAAELARLRALGILETGPRQLIIRDVDALNALAHGVQFRGD